MTQYPSNSYHYAGIGKETVDGTGVAPTVLMKFQDFSGNAQIETESDEGHIGARGRGTVNTRVKAFGEPEITDRFRPDGGLEQLLLAFMGGVTTTQQGGTTAYKHVFSFADTLPTWSITHGFNVSSEVAKRFCGGVCNTLDLNFPVEESPKVTAQFLTNFPEFGVVEPTLTYPTTLPFMAGQLTFYTGAADATPNTPQAGYSEGSVKLDNGYEGIVEAGMSFGTIVKDQGDLTVEGSYTIKYIEDTQRKWATGSTSGTTVATTGMTQSLRWKYVGPLIASTYYYTLDVEVPHAEITNVTPTEGGDGAKQYEVEFQGMLDDAQTKFMAEAISKITAIA